MSDIDKYKKCFLSLKVAMELEQKYALQEAGFEIVKEGDIERGQWAHELVNNYPKEVVAVFGTNPYEVFASLEDMWDTDGYDDGASGLYMTWSEWATYFSNDMAMIVYDALVQARKKIREANIE